LILFSERKNPPVFTKKPSEQIEDMEGKLVKIEGRVSGSQPMSVSWFKDSTEIHSSDKYDISFKSNVAVLCIKSSQMSDSGRYSCQASNEAGRASCDVTVGITGGFDSQSLRLILCLLCFVLRTPSKQKSPQEEKDIDIVELLRNVDPKEYEKYARMYGITDYRGLLQAIEQLKKEKAEESGRPVTLCTVSASDVFMSVDHVLNTVVVDRNWNVETESLMRTWSGHSHCFSFTDRTPVCVSVGNVDFRVLILFSFPQPVTVVKDISDRSVFTNKEVVFECEVKINYPEITLSWYKGTQKLDTSDKYDISISGDRHLLKIKKCQSSDQGNYRVVCGPHISSAKLTVMEIIAEKDQLKFSIVKDKTFKITPLKEVKTTQEHIEGKDSVTPVMEETCKHLEVAPEKHAEVKETEFAAADKVISGSEDISQKKSISLKKRGQKLAKTKEVADEQIPPKFITIKDKTQKVTQIKGTREKHVKAKEVDNERPEFDGEIDTSERESHTLTIKDCTLADEGEYTAVAGDNKSTAELIITVPQIKTTDQNYVTDTGKPIVMAVPYSAYPKAEADWLYDNTSLPKDNIHTSADRTEYRLKDPKKSDEGRYKIHIKNKHGEGEAFIKLDVIDVPGPVKNLQVVDTADGEVSLAWEEPESDGGSKVIGYVVERRDVKRKTWTLATDHIDSPEYTVTGLQRDSMYLFRVCARNRVGSGPNVDTDKPVQAKNKFGENDFVLIHVPEAPLNVIVGNVTKFGCTVSWEPPESDGGSPITSYIVELRDRTSVKWSPVQVTKADELSAIINDVIENKEYIFRVKAENKAGVGKPSFIVFVSPAAPSAPKDFKVLEVTRQHVHLSWEAPEHDGGSPLTGYQPGHSTVTIAKTKRDDSSTYIIEATNSSGRATATVDVNILDKPGPPAAFDISEITNETCFLAWNPPRDDGGSRVTNYIVERRATDSEIWHRLSSTIKHTTYKAVDLVKFKEYIFRVFAENQFGVGPPAEHLPIIARYPFGRSPDRRTDVWCLNLVSFSLTVGSVSGSGTQVRYLSDAVLCVQRGSSCGSGLLG
uniref:Titin n=1 Tax=Seriola dumerili TaxID=41447 RepID=A0A3B4TD64_SERDU